MDDSTISNYSNYANYETWEPTFHLRWKNETFGFDNAKLQQLWHCRTNGKKEWRNLPTVASNTPDKEYHD